MPVMSDFPITDNKLAKGVKDLRFPPAGFTCRTCLLAKVAVPKKYVAIAPHHISVKLCTLITGTDRRVFWASPWAAYTGAHVGQDEYSFDFFEPTRQGARCSADDDANRYDW